MRFSKKDMKFTPIDMDTWPRREHFEYYSGMVRTNYSLNVELDVTKLRKRCRKKEIHFFPAMMYAIMKAVNENQEFCMGYDEEGRLGFYDQSNPTYTVFHEDDKSFSDLWSEYDSDFSVFYKNVQQDLAEWKDVHGMKTKPGRTGAFTCISCVPWLDFKAFASDTPGPGKMYYPIITFGKYHKDADEHYRLTFCLFINHAAADGYHSSKLLNEIQENINTCKEWIR